MSDVKSCARVGGCVGVGVYGVEPAQANRENVPPHHAHRTPLGGPRVQRVGLYCAPCAIAVAQSLSVLLY